MLVCSRHIPKVCSGTVYARLFTTLAGEQKIVEKFIFYRKKEESLIRQLKDIRVFPFQIGMQELAEKVYIGSVAAGIKGIGVGTFVGMVAISENPLCDLMRRLGIADLALLATLTGVGIGALSAFRVMNFLSHRVPDYPISIEHRDYRKIKWDLAFYRNRISSLHKEAEDMAIASCISGPFD